MQQCARADARVRLVEVQIESRSSSRRAESREASGVAGWQSTGAILGAKSE